jgi:flagellar motor switch protein FliG
MPASAAGLLGLAATGTRPDVALRMANLDQITPEIVNKIAKVIGEKLQAIGQFSRESYGGVRAVSEMFNQLDSGRQQGNSRRHRDAESQSGRDDPATDVRIRGSADIST